MAKRNREKIEFESFDELFGTAPVTEDGIVMLKTSLLYPFFNHPFHVRDDEEMEELMASTEKHGVLVPLLVRKKENGFYEMISGHRRKHACDRLGIAEVPVLIRNYSDDEAIIVMVDSNIQREHLLISEKAFALRMKLEAMNRQGERTDLTSYQNDGKYDGNKKGTSNQNDGRLRGETSAALLGKDIGKSESTVRRLIRLTYLIKPFLDLVDEKKMSLLVGEMLSFLSEENQQLLFGFLHESGREVSGDQARILKELSEQGRLNEEEIQNIFLGKKEKNIKLVSINLKSKKLYEYFPSDYSKKQMEDVIFSLLLDWRDRNANLGNN